MLRHMGKFRRATFDNFTPNGLELYSMKQFLFVGAISDFKKYNQNVIQDLGAPYDYGKTVHFNKK